MIVRDTLINNDDYYFSLLNQYVINEELSMSGIKDVISRIRDKSRALKNFISKFNSTKNFKTKKYFATIILVLVLSMTNIKLHDSISHLGYQVAKENTVDLKKLQEILMNQKIKSNIQRKSINIQNAKVSDDGKEFIKKEEKLRLSAYAIGDGKITIGYGHSYKKSASPYKVGDKITKKEAENLYKKDLFAAQEGVKRMFLQWKHKDINVPIDQSMFDCMVSMAFNMGVDGFRGTQFVQYLKKCDYVKAADELKTTKISSKFMGLYERRQREYELFVENFKYIE